MSASMSQFFDLDGKVALVTGGGQGIGEAICRRLAQAGARAAVFDLHEQNSRKIADELGGLALTGDVTSELDIQRAHDQAEKQLGPLAIVVNNAGIVGRSAATW